MHIMKSWDEFRENTYNQIPFTGLLTLEELPEDALDPVILQVS